MSRARLAPAALLAAALLLPAAARALKGIGPGDAPPPFALPDLAGEVVTLDSLAGSPAALLFWSTWSPRSAEILEDFRGYHGAYAEKGLRIVAINVDGENLDAARAAAVRRFAGERDLPFPVLLDARLEAFAAYGVMAHPSTVVLGADGRIAYTLGGYPLSLREELKENLLKVLGLYAPPPPPDLPAVGYVPQGRALQHYNLGRALMAKGQPGRALTAFRRAAERDPAFLDAAVMAARLSLIEGEPGEAEALLARVDPGEIGRADLHFLKGSLLLNQGDLEGAEAVFVSTAERFPEEGWGGWGLGLVALARGNAAAAAAAMERAHPRTPVNPETAAAVRRFLKTAWIRGESAPQEERFVGLFPALAEIRDRYRRMFGR